MSKIVFDDNVIYEIGKNNQKQGPFCSACWDNNQKKIRLHTNYKNEYICPVCKTVVPFISKKTCVTKTNHKISRNKNTDEELDMKSLKSAFLYSIPTSLIISLSISANLVTKGTIYQSQYLPYFLLIFIISTIFLIIPITISIYKRYKYRGWIIGLALCCFLPFGTLLYFVSLIWSIALLFKQDSY